jgi:hypothetical protein
MISPPWAFSHAWASKNSYEKQMLGKIWLFTPYCIKRTYEIFKMYEKV